jgi:archaeal flagellar protein FlaJ
MVYRLFSKVYPKNVRNAYIKLLRYLGVKANADVYVGFTVFVGLLVGLSAAFFTTLLYPPIPIYVWWVAFFFLIETLIYVPLMLKVDRNAREIENILPDALQLMSSNMKSGLTIDQSLLASARPEFGIFEKELNTIGKEVATGKPLETALMDSTKRVSSEKYEKTMELLASGLRSGGELARLLDQTSANLKHQKIVDQKVRSNVMMYVIFIFSAICFGAPILFGLSSFLVTVISQIFGQIDIPSTASDKFSIPLISISADGISQSFVMVYIITSMVISSAMGGLIIGLISKGKEKYGIRYIPILIIVSILMFFIVRMLVSNLMGGIIDL